VKSPAKLPQPSKRKENVGRIARKEEEEEGERENGGWQVVWGDDIPLAVWSGVQYSGLSKASALYNGW
jgi:hypothetical protein